MAKRPPIPADMERDVLLEAGHRYAIHTCRQTPVELAHITPWSRCREHTFDNLIALCPTCHTRFDRGEIDRKAMTTYKARLIVVSGRLTSYEFRLLRRMRETGDETIVLLEDLELLVVELIRSNILVAGDANAVPGAEVVRRRAYTLTGAGREFVAKYLP